MSISLDKPRRFAHVDGFDDKDVQYVEIMPNGYSFLCSANNSVRYNAMYSISTCEHFVKIGVWKELP